MIRARAWRQGFAGAHNTGPRIPLTTGVLNGTKRIQSTAAGQVMSGLDVPVGNQIYVAHNNVTVRHCRILADNHFYAVQTAANVTGTVIEYCELGATTYQKDLLPYGGSSPVLNIRNCNIHHVVDGGRGSAGQVYENNWVHDLKVLQLATDITHNDGFQISSGDGFVIRGCRIEMPINGNSAVFAKGDFGPISNILVEDCYLDGGGYTLYISQNNQGVSGVTARNNVFGPNFTYSRIGPRTGVTLIDNVDYLGQPVT